MIKIYHRNKDETYFIFNNLDISIFYLWRLCLRFYKGKMFGYNIYNSLFLSIFLIVGILQTCNITFYSLHIFLRSLKASRITSFKTLFLQNKILDRKPTVPRFSTKEGCVMRKLQDCRSLNSFLRIASDGTFQNVEFLLKKLEPLLIGNGLRLLTKK